MHWGSRAFERRAAASLTSKHRRGRRRESNPQPFQRVQSIKIVTAGFFFLFCFETVDVLAGEDVGAKTAKLEKKSCWVLNLVKGFGLNLSIPGRLSVVRQYCRRKEPLLRISLS